MYREQYQSLVVGRYRRPGGAFTHMQRLRAQLKRSSPPPENVILPETVVSICAKMRICVKTIFREWESAMNGHRR